MSGDQIVVGIVLKGDGKGLVGEVRISEKELDKLGETAKRTGKKAARGAKGIDKLGNESKQTAAEARRLNDQAKNLGLGFSNVQRRALLLKTAILALATGAMVRLGGSFLDAASTSERYATTLKVVLGDVDEANRLFDDMATFASRVPFQYEQIMGAATQLAGVVRGGVDEVNQLIPIIADIAAGTGISIEETTGQIIRMYSAGAASADLFRERGISAALGFQAGVSYSTEETMNRLIGSWEKGTSRFKGATDEMADDWVGILSMMGDKWFQYRNWLMDAAPFDYLKTTFQIVNESFDENTDDMRNSAEELGRDVVDMAKSIALGTADILDIAGPAVSSIGGALDIFWQGFKDLPSWMQEVGLVGGLLFGRVGWAPIAAVSALNELANQLDAATQKSLKDMDAPQWLQDFTHSPTDTLLGKDKLKPDGAGLPDVSFKGKEGGQKNQSMRDRLSSLFKEVDARIAADRGASGETPASARRKRPAGDGNAPDKTAINRVAALENERDMLYQIAEAREVYGRDAAFMIDTIKAETEARKIGLEVGSDEYNRYIETALAITDLKRETEDATEAGKLHKKSVSEIESAFDSLPKSYNRARDAAYKWHTETLAGLDKTKAGYFEFSRMADEVLSQQLSDAYRDSLEASEEWADGLERAYLKIEDRAFNLAAQSENMFQRIDQAAEDSYVNMIKGTESVSEAFRNMADNILTEMLRISYQQSIAQPLMGGLRKFLGGLWGGGGGGDASLGAQYRDVQYGHSGTIIGQATDRGRVAAAVFAGAPRHHMGTAALGSDEVPFIGRKGEGVFTPRQMDNADRLIAAMGGRKIEINVNYLGGADGPEIGVEQRRQPGIDIIDIIVPAMEQATDSGRMDAVNQLNYGQSRQPVPGA